MNTSIHRAAQRSRSFTQTAGLGLLAGLVLALSVMPAAAQATTTTDLQNTLQDVVGADGSRYDAKDTDNVGLDTIKIIDCECGTGVNDPKYVAVSHHLIDGHFRVRLSTSDDLLNWEYVATLDNDGSQPTIQRLSDGSYLVADENTSSTVNDGHNHVRLMHYDDYASLASGEADDTYDTELSLAPTAEGTPDIRQVTWTGTPGDLENSEIVVTFHYYDNQDVDREATGTLTDWDSWDTSVRTSLNSMLDEYELGGNYGGRTAFTYGSNPYEVVEGQGTKNDWASWRLYLHDINNADLLALEMDVAYGQTSFGNPKVSIVQSPDNTGQAIVASSFLFGEGAPNGAGEMIYYHNLS